MDAAKRELVRAWLIKARNDLDTARQISALPDGHLDTAIYHCQQAAEKAVKGFLALHDHPLQRSHDVERLVTLASTYESSLTDCVDAAILLTPYATAYEGKDPGALLHELVREAIQKRESRGRASGQRSAHVALADVALSGLAGIGKVTPGIGRV